MVLLARPLDEDQTRWLDWFTMVCYSSQGLLNSLAYGWWHRADRAHRSVAFARPDRCGRDPDDDFDDCPVGENRQSPGPARARPSFVCPRGFLFGGSNIANLPDDDGADDPPYAPLPAGDENDTSAASDRV